MPLLASPCFGDTAAAAAVLVAWRQCDAAAARLCLHQVLDNQAGPPGLLLRELQSRLAGEPGPRILLDGVWFSRPHGGITRVWQQILRCWDLSGLLSGEAPVRILERNSHLAIVSQFDAVMADPIDPLDWQALGRIASENERFAAAWGCDVFVSSWVTTCGQQSPPRVRELALVHDCIPERSQIDPLLRGLRTRWLKGAASHLAVSAATAQDLEGLLQFPPQTTAWCHLAPESCFATLVAHASAPRLWQQLQHRAGLRLPYVLLPGTSSIGSYKNPELVAQALLEPGLEDLQLVLSGLAAEKHASALTSRWPVLEGRVLVAGLTDLELALAYRHALAVVLPSRVEGFGLPAVEALASGATVLVAESRGLREAGGAACPRFHPEKPHQLAAWLKLLLDEPSAAWLGPRLERRRQSHLMARHPDLFGLCLLAMARKVWEAPS